jgi:uncharacterized protein involved in exopolysaccharide biosynthesis
MVAKPLVTALNAQIKQLTENNDNLNKQLQALKNAPPQPELAQLQQQLAAQKATIETYKQAINVVINNLQHLA